MEDFFYCIFYNCVSTNTISGIDWHDKETGCFRFDLNKNNHLYVGTTIEFLYFHEYGLNNEETRNFLLDLVLKYETDDALYCIENKISLSDIGDMSERLTARNAPIPALPPEVRLMDDFIDETEVADIDIDDIQALENRVEGTRRRIDAIIERIRNRLL